MNNFFNWIRFRKFLNDIHLWVGLASGIFVLLICLSGTIYVFNTEIRELSRPEVFRVDVPQNANKLNPEELISIVGRKTGGKVVSLKVPANLEKPYVLTVKMPEKTNQPESIKKTNEKPVGDSKEKPNS